MGKYRHLWPLGVWLLLAVTAMALLFANAMEERDEILERGARQVQDRANMVAEHAARVLEGAELVMGATLRDISALQEAGEQAQWNALRGWADLIPYVSRMVVLDDKGMMALHSDFFPVPQQDLSDRSYFAHHKSAPDQRIWLGEPILGVISKQYIFTLSRRISKSGKFGGVIVANIPHDSFDEFYRAIGIEKEGFINLQRLDGMILTRFPYSDGAVGQKIDNSRIFPLLASGAPRGVRRTISPVDGRERLTAFRRLSHFDAVAMAGISVDSLLSGWRAGYYRSGTMLVLSFAVITMLFAAFLVRNQRAMEATGKRLEAERRYREMFEQMLSGLVELDVVVDQRGNVADCLVSDVNPAMARIFGMPREAMEGRSLREILPGIENFWIEALAGVAANGTPCQFTRILSPLKKHLEVSIFRRDNGKCVMMLMDASEQERRREALEAAVDQLSEKNAELERFAYISSHDLKEPLRGITSFSQLLKRRYGGQLDAQADEYIEFITAAAKRMHDLITDLLDYSRVASRAVPFARVDLRVLCNTACENLRQAISESRADILVDAMPEVVGDATQLGLLMQNLISNAIKFVPGERKPRVVVSAEPGEVGWIISVADNGIGIEPTSQDIFEIFRRLHAGQEYPGTGVGLAICRRIVQRHGGRIWYESRPGEGTVFRFTLPRGNPRP